MIFLLIILTIIILDQLTKIAALKNLKNNVRRPIFNNKIHLTLRKNKGAALNLLEKHPMIINITSIIFIFGLIFYLFKVIKIDRFVLTKLSLSFIIGGGIGNLTDRIKRGFVVDFFTFNIKKCPVFNIADIFVIFGMIVLQCLVIFKKTPIE